jgi:hypothetical protein
VARNTIDCGHAGARGRASVSFGMGLDVIEGDPVVGIVVVVAVFGHEFSPGTNSMSESAAWLELE